MSTPAKTGVKDQLIAEMSDFLERENTLDSAPVFGITRGHIAAVFERLRAAEADAERYRWIRSADELPVNLMAIDMAGERLDAAIDAAMQKEVPA